MPSHSWDFDTDVVCPWCGQVQDGIANMTGEERPETGDASLCFNCGVLATVDWDTPFGLRKCTSEERADFLSDPRIKETLEVWMFIDAMRKRGIST